MGKTYAQDWKYGTVGEFVTWNYLQRLKGVKQVVDVRDDKFFQSVDVDFLMECYDRQFYWVEVKTDSQAQTTGNIVFELTTNGNEGCLKKSEADYIAYFIPANGKLYMMDAKKLKEYTLNSTHKVYPMGDNATGHLLSIEELTKRNVIVDMEQCISMIIEKNLQEGQ